MVAKRLVEVALDAKRFRMLAVVMVEEACVVVAKVLVPVTASVPLSERLGTLRFEANKVVMLAVPMVVEATVVVAKVEVPVKLEVPDTASDPLSVIDDVAVMVPPIAFPCSVVEASDAEEVAVSVPIEAV